MDELIEGVKLLQGHGPISEDDARRAAAENAEKQKVQADENKLGGVILPYNVRKVSERGGDGGNSATYLLRRIARVSPETLAAYERGEFPSVAAAARAAGIERKEKPLLSDVVASVPTLAKHCVLTEHAIQLGPRRVSPSYRVANSDRIGIQKLQRSLQNPNPQALRIWKM